MKPNSNLEWLKRQAELEDKYFISVGGNMDLNELIFLGACSLLKLSAAKAEDGCTVISSPEGWRITAAVLVAKRVWTEVLREK